MQLTLGCDPEAFLKSGNKYVSAFNLIPGTKEKPFKVQKGQVQVDGNAVEFGIEPAKTAKEFNENISVVLDQLEALVRQADPGLKIDFVPVANFDPKEFKVVPREAKILGCDPDFNIQGTVNPPPYLSPDTPVRTAAGHIHIGWTEDANLDDPIHFEDCRFIAQTFYNLGPKNRLGKPYSQAEYSRLNYYGSNGAFRPKPYGVELRSFSNFWVPDPKDRVAMFEFVIDTICKLETN